MDEGAQKAPIAREGRVCCFCRRPFGREAGATQLVSQAGFTSTVVLGNQAGEVAGRPCVTRSLGRRESAGPACALVRLLFWAEGEEERRAERDRNILNFDELMKLVKANLKGTKPKIEKLEREEPEDPVAFRSLVVQ